MHRSADGPSGTSEFEFVDDEAAAKEAEEREYDARAEAEIASGNAPDTLFATAAPTRGHARTKAAI